MTARSLAVLLLLPLVGCAWARRENRPVWTSFEDHLVPADGTAFYVALPLTVPAGLVAIVVDTLVAHPLQVVDDALDDTGDLWRGIDLEQAYYTQAGLLPVRAVATPLWFVGSFLGRSMFDVGGDEAPGTRPEVSEKERAAIGKRVDATLRWLAAIADGSDRALAGSGPVGADEAQQQALRAALGVALDRGTAIGRLRVFEACARVQVLRPLVDWCRGLADASAVVRWKALRDLPPHVVVPDGLADRLLADPDPAVRELAAGRAR